MDASIGMGYGTTLTPLLLIIGFLPLQVVPAVLLGQLVGGVVGGISHHKFGNIKLDFRQDEAIKKRLRGLGYIPRSFDSKVILVLAICGTIGALVAVFVAISIPKVLLKTYIGLMVLGIGIILLIRKNHSGKFSWKTLSIVGVISSFNKGVSGGGYGPLITGGQIISGREAKSAVGSTTFAEALVCIVAFSAYVLVKKGDIYWTLAASTSIGSILSAPFAALTVKKAKTKKLKSLIGAVITLLGILTLVKVIF